MNAYVCAIVKKCKVRNLDREEFKYIEKFQSLTKGLNRCKVIQSYWFFSVSVCIKTLIPASSFIIFLCNVIQLCHIMLIFIIESKFQVMICLCLIYGFIQLTQLLEFFLQFSRRFSLFNHWWSFDNSLILFSVFSQFLLFIYKSLCHDSNNMSFRIMSLSNC